MKGGIYINKCISKKKELLEKREIKKFKNDIKNNDNSIKNINYINSLNINWNNKKVNKNLSQRSYIKNNYPLKYIKKNNYIHKSLSQKIIKNNINSFRGDDDINKKKFLEKTESNEFNKNKISISKNVQVQILSKKNTENNNINGNNISITNYLKNNEKYSTEETLNFSEVESFPIKINLKINKKGKNDENKKEIIKEKKNYFSNESKKDLNKIDKNNKCKNSNNYKSKKQNKIENKNIEKKNNLIKKSLNINKNNSQENIIKKDGCIQKKENGNDKVEEKITVSIRNKYKNLKKYNQI